MAEPLLLRLLGVALIEDPRGPIPLVRRKSTALLSYLALEPSFHSRDGLAAFLWPDCGQARARANLRSCIFEIGRAGGDILLMEQDLVRLSREALRVDVDEFRALAAPCPGHGVDQVCSECGPRLEAAARLWRGEFMAGFTLADSGEFDNWQLGWSERLRGEYCALLRRLTADLQAKGRFEEAEDCVRRWIEAEPYEEEARSRQIQLLFLIGRRAHAVQRFEDWSRISIEELGSSPSSALRALVAQFLPKAERGGKNFSKASLPSGMRSAEPKSPFRAGLVGRGEELDSLGAAILAQDTRLLTIIGTGGLGKTLLARGLLAERCGDFHGGAFFVDLSAMRDPDLVPQAVAAVLGVSEASRGDIGLEELIAARLGGARTLIVLDNFEQVLQARNFARKLLASCPRLVILATSRERLGIEGEVVHELEPLLFPWEEKGVRASDRARFPALELLALRGAENAPLFELSDENAPACAALCARLDGLPLALELAASRLTILEPAELLERLDRRLDLLASSDAAFPERHRKLRAVIDWSYELLEPAEQELFARLSVFAGSFDLEAAEEVCGAPSGLAFDLIDGLSSLVAKSLLRRSSELGRTRFSFLESIRDYAAERLSLREDQAEVEVRHARHFLDRAERLSPAMRGRQQRETIGLLDLDQANFRLSVDRLIGAGLTKEAYRICLALEWYWYRSGHFSLGESALSAVLKLEGRDEAGVEALRGRCIRAYGWIRFVLGAWREAHESYLQAVSILEREGDLPGLARCLSDLGVVERWIGNRVAGYERCLRAIAIAREIGERLPLAYALIWCYGTTGGKSVDAGQLAGLEEAIRLAREGGDPWAESHALESLGDYFREDGRPEEAVPCFEEALRGFQSLGDEWMEAWTLEGFGMNICALGEAGASERLLESLRIFVRLGDKSDAIYVIGELGLVSFAARDAERADLLLGAYSALGKEYGIDATEDASWARRPLDSGRDGEGRATGSRVSLGLAIREADSRGSREWLRGRLMAYDEIVALALGQAAR